MLVFSCKTSFQIIKTRYSRIYQLCGFQIPYPKSLSQISESTNPPSFTVDYLVNSCGISPQKALSLSKRFNVGSKTREKPDSVLSFLETIGFSKTHIAKLISKRPSILHLKLGTTLKPKIKQLQDLGFSGLKLVELIASDPNILIRSVERITVPSLEFIKSFVGTDENVIRVVKRIKWFRSGSLESLMQPKIDILQHYNVPNSLIAQLIMNQPSSFLFRPEKFKEMVEITMGFGFKTDSRAFIAAFHVLSSMSESTRTAKIKLFKDLGWSEEEVFSAFKKQPFFLSLSEKKIKEGLDFFAKMLNWNASVISSHPLLLMFSLKERIIPRFTVYQILKSKKLLGEESKLISVFNLSEKVFMHKYVSRYQDKFPELLKTYKDQKINDSCLL